MTGGLAERCLIALAAANLVVLLVDLLYHFVRAVIP
jgi:hypothetical protein